MTDYDGDNDLDDEISSTDEPDSVALLISILQKLDSVRGPGQHKRSLVGSMMKQVNPVRFRAGSVVKAAVEAAVKSKLVEVGGEKGLAWCKLIRPRVET
jgi:hypothetical protein